MTLTGWGRTAPTVASVAEPQVTSETAGLLRAPGPRGAIARGLGRSYNNAAQNAGGLVISTAGLDRIRRFDTERGLITAEAGVSLERIMLTGLPHGWFVPVTPGTRLVSVGGAIAADVHGKNHHRAGSFACHVRSLELVLPSGESRIVTPEGDPALFWATAGGMGLTGVIVQATLQLIRVASARVRVDTVKARDIDETMAHLADADGRYGYTVAWSDCLASGAATGRSVITCGDFAEPDELPARARRRPLAFRPRVLGTAPPAFPPGLMSRRTIGALNAAWYARAPRRRTGEITSIGSFFHPLDAIRGWNRAYGPAGFVQYQYVVPFGQEHVVRRTFERTARSGAPSFVTVLKRFGPADPGLLSFPMPGWTLALDFPAATPGLAGLLDWLDEQVADAGGRVYLAKDGRVPPGMLARMYPRLEEFRALRAELDPCGTLVSDLSRRLGL